MEQPPLKIVLVNKYASVSGGSDRYVLDLAALLRSHGHDVRLLAFKPEDHPAPLPGIYLRPRVTAENRGSLGTTDLPAVARDLLWNRQVALAMGRLIDDNRPDMVHFHKIYPQLSISPVVIAAARGVPIVQTAHDFEFVSASPVDPEGRGRDTTSVHLADKVVNTANFHPRRRIHVPRVTRWAVASQFMADTYSRHGIDAQVVPCYTPRRQSAGGRVRSFDERSGIVFAGRLDFRKGIADVIHLARSNPSIPVTIAGMGEMEAEVQEAASTIENLAFLGRLDAEGVAEMHAGARVAVVPSRWAEPAGLVAVEAMIQGTPVAAYATGGLGEFVAGSEGGLTVTPYDVGELTATVGRLHDDPELWARHSDLGLRGVHHNTSPEQHIKDIETLYARPLSRG